MATSTTPELVEAIIISGPEKGRVVQLDRDKVASAVTPTEKKAMDELLAIYNNYLLNADVPGATQQALRQLEELKEKYRGMA